MEYYTDIVLRAIIIIYPLLVGRLDIVTYQRSKLIALLPINKREATMIFRYLFVLIISRWIESFRYPSPALKKQTAELGMTRVFNDR